jgi:hypothetical protein
VTPSTIFCSDLNIGKFAKMPSLPGHTLAAIAACWVQGVREEVFHNQTRAAPPAIESCCTASSDAFVTLAHSSPLAVTKTS